jgi:voltage-gated potassium channel
MSLDCQAAKQFSVRSRENNAPKYLSSPFSLYPSLHFTWTEEVMWISFAKRQWLREQHRRNASPSLRRPIFAVALLLFIFTAGTIGYHIIEDAPLFDSLYFTVVTLTTIGYGEMENFSDQGRLFTIVLVLLDIGIFTYAISSLTQFFISGTMLQILGVQHMQREIARLKDHIIVCGYGRLGKNIVEHLRHSGQPYVIIDSKSDEMTDSFDEKYLVIHGDASDDSTLLKAGIERAQTLIVATPEDPINVYITLSARNINPKIRIIARAIDETAETKLIRAGADRVVSPIERGADYMAQTALRPSVVDFLDVTSTPGGEQIQLEELVVPPNSIAEGKSLGDLQIGRKYSLMIVAIRHMTPEERVEFNPRAESIAKAGDTLVILGKVENLQQLENDLQDGIHSKG